MEACAVPTDTDLRFHAPEKCLSSGSKALSAALDRMRVTTVGGTDTFDAASISTLYE